jgi:hypothetical protein
VKQSVNPKTKKKIKTQINEKCNGINSADENKKYPTTGLAVTGLA